MTALGEVTGRLVHVAVIGAGPAGRSFSRHLLAYGLRVTLEDVLPSNLRSTTAEFAAEEPPVPSGNLTLVSSVEDAVRTADLAVDFVPDELESKLEILSMIDRMAPPATVLLTPTDVLSISDLASCTYRPARCFALAGLPRHRIFSPAAELRLLYPPGSDPAVLSSVQQFLEGIGLPFETALDPHPSHLAGR